jgi:hypothetical protein
MDVELNITPPPEIEIVMLSGYGVPVNVGGGGGSLTIREVDSSPSVTATELVFPNGSLTVAGTVVTVNTGNTILSGSGAPLNSLGVDGDFYFDSADAFFYGPKAGGAWADEYVIMTGSPGANTEVTSASSSSVAIGSGSRTFTLPTAANRGWVVGMRLRAAFDGSNYVEGPITALTATSVTINVDNAVGSGTRTSWNLGIAGDRGATGSAGGTGTAGAAATIAVGSVTTGAAGTSVAITNSGTSSAAVFNFTIPRGDTGATGSTGAAGAAATITVGTVTTGAAGSSVSITNSGSSSAAVFNFTIPRGDTGATGSTGAAGQGVPTGGSTNDILAKTSGTDYATAWTNTPTLNSLTLTPETITYGATMAVNAATSTKKHITLAGNGTISNPTNAVDGRVLIFRLRQDGTGTRVPVWDTKYRFRGDLATVTLSTAAGMIDRVGFEYDATDDRWDCVSFIKGS